MNIIISHYNKWVGNPPTHYSQLIEVWFNDKEFELFKTKCYQVFKNKYYAFFEIEMFLNSEERDVISNIIELSKINNYKSNRNSVIIYHKNYESV